MTDLDPCLAGCESALAEAEELLAVLAATGCDEAAVAPIRHSIARLRREVDRLRGLKVPQIPRKADPLWVELGSEEAPWPAAGSPNADVF